MVKQIKYSSHFPKFWCKEKKRRFARDSKKAKLRSSGSKKFNIVFIKCFQVTWKLWFSSENTWRDSDGSRKWQLKRVLPSQLVDSSKARQRGSSNQIKLALLSAHTRCKFRARIYSLCSFATYKSSVTALLFTEWVRACTHGGESHPSVCFIYTLPATSTNTYSRLLPLHCRRRDNLFKRIHTINAITHTLAQF